MSDDKVGYGCPPKRHRFQKGRSGNPKGRPKGSKGLANLVRDVAAETITLSVNGRSRKMSATEAMLHRLKMDGLQGKPRAAERFLELIQRFEQKDVQVESPNMVEMTGLEQLTEVECSLLIYLMSIAKGEPIEKTWERYNILLTYGSSYTYRPPLPLEANPTQTDHDPQDTPINSRLKSARRAGTEQDQE